MRQLYTYVPGDSPERAMPSYSCTDYFLARVPDFQDILPTYPVPVAIMSALSLYWDRFQPALALATPDETLLTERQKVVVSLRAVLGAVPVFTRGLTQPFLTEAHGGPSGAKFEELSKLVKSLLPQWQTELKNMEAFEGVYFDLLPNVPGYLQSWREYSKFDRSVGYVFSTGSWFVETEGQIQGTSSNNPGGIW